MKIGILDDEEIWREILYKNISNFSKKNNMQIDIIVLKNNEELYNICDDIDLLLLDISMPKVSGITIKDSLPKHVLRIIFVTSHDEYMIKAFGDKVYGFVDKSHLERLYKYIRKIYTINICQEKTFLDGHYIKNEAIYYLKSEGVYTTIFADKEIVVRKQLKEFEAELKKDIFMRVHKSYIVNLQHIKSIGHTGVVLDDDTYVKITRGIMKNIKKEYAKYMMRL